MSNSPSGARVWQVLTRDHTCHSHVYRLVVWTIPAITLQNVTHFTVPRRVEGWVDLEDNKFQLDERDYVMFRKHLDINWDDAMKLSSSSLDDMWEYCKEILLTGMNEFIPRSKHFQTNPKKKFQPFNSELKNTLHKTRTSEAIDFK